MRMNVMEVMDVMNPILEGLLPSDRTAIIDAIALECSPSESIVWLTIGSTTTHG